MAEEVKRKRGRPRKNPVLELPQEIQSLVNEVLEKQQLLQEEIPKPIKEVEHKEGDWDVKIGDPIEYFDKRLSYEITGYNLILHV